MNITEFAAAIETAKRITIYVETFECYVPTTKEIMYKHVVNNFDNDENTQIKAELNLGVLYIGE